MNVVAASDSFKAEDFRRAWGPHSPLRNSRLGTGYMAYKFVSSDLGLSDWIGGVAGFATLRFWVPLRGVEVSKKIEEINKTVKQSIKGVASRIERKLKFFGEIVCFALGVPVPERGTYIGLSKRNFLMPSVK
jgi:hypothetical protein